MVVEMGTGSIITLENQEELLLLDNYYVATPVDKDEKPVGEPCLLQCKLGEDGSTYMVKCKEAPLLTKILAAMRLKERVEKGRIPTFEEFLQQRMFGQDTGSDETDGSDGPWGGIFE